MLISKHIQNLRGITDLKVKAKVIKLLEKNIGKYQGL